ncbi:hypothetical protein CVT25_011150 [Psilocybe cyanescens]|uniref:Uncharacterized protein n=1 Tax=Psilocybe cyanescens TaxID=93625 RepID=A0A409WGU6_PSICY|nr:hypothetical protein CVT25_011150 [Psilocybe cyanescens]
MLKCGSSLSDDDYVDQVALHRLDALPSICQRNILLFNGILLTGKLPKNPTRQLPKDLLIRESLASSVQKTVLGPSLCDGETQADYLSSRVEPSSATAVEKYFSKSLEYEHLAMQCSQMDPDRSQTPCSGVVWAASSIINISALVLISSSVIQVHLGFSHRVDFESCEGLPSLLPESFKSTAGHSDDILPRPIFNGENENQERDANAKFSISPENRPDTSRSSETRVLAISGSDTAITDVSLTSTKQVDQSHEDTGTGCASHHSDIPSSSPLVHIEYTQSDPYFTPATIVRAHSPDFRTDVVGIQELVSSSPPPSPSMTSNYLPSSSPISSSSPMDRSTRTPPTSSPIVPGEYAQRPSEGVQEDFYMDETYAAFSHYPLDHGPYQPLNRHASDDFFQLPTPHQHMSSISETLVPPTFIQNFLDATTDTPHNVEQYPPTELNLTASETDLSLPGPSNRPLPTPPSIADAIPNPLQSRQAAPKNVVPNPKRPTLAGVRQQQKKLSRPFRSPVIHTPVRLAPKPPTTSSGPLISSANSAFLKDAAETSKTPTTAAAASSSSQVSGVKLKHRTTRASSQFKSPLSSSSTSSDEAALVRLTPTIQSLERKLQLLRRALKVREDVQEEVLEGLVNKWSEAGKEVAWEVWDAVKDNVNTAEENEGNDRKGKKRAMEDSWEWDESPDSKKSKADGGGERNWGWDVVPVAERVGEEDSHAEGGGESHTEEDRTEEIPQPTLGTMLLQLGIAPETFGWSEEEGTFIDNNDKGA